MTIQPYILSWERGKENRSQNITPTFMGRNVQKEELWWLLSQIMRWAGRSGESNQLEAKSLTCVMGKWGKALRDQLKRELYVSNMASVNHSQKRELQQASFRVPQAMTLTKFGFFNTSETWIHQRRAMKVKQWEILGWKHWDYCLGDRSSGEILSPGTNTQRDGGWASPAMGHHWDAMKQWEQTETLAFTLNTRKKTTSFWKSDQTQVAQRGYRVSILGCIHHWAGPWPTCWGWPCSEHRVGHRDLQKVQPTTARWKYVPAEWEITETRFNSNHSAI